MTRPRRGRTVAERVIAVENAPRRAAANQNRVAELHVAIAGGPAPMTSRLAEILRAMVDRQRARERGSTT